MKPNVIIFGTENFNKSFIEVKDQFDFNFNFFDGNVDPKKFSKTNVFLVDVDMLQKSEIKKLIISLNDKKILLIDRPNTSSKINFNEKIVRPFELIDLNKRLTHMLSSFKFNINSSINIKNYILDKNEKKLKQGPNYVILTEREIQLLELLFNQKKSVTKNFILKEVWNYAEDADTHTVETHVYRLRKKIKEKFLDDELIINNNEGYSI